MVIALVLNEPLDKAFSSGACIANQWIGGIAFMKRPKIYLLFTVWLTVLLFASLVDNAVFAVQQEDETWSFDFKNCSFSDALDQISKATGIEILTNGQTDKTPFSKSFKDQAINQILEGLFRRKNHAIMWRYSESGLKAISIWVFEKGDSRRGFDTGSFVKYKAPAAKRNLTKNNAKIAVDHTRSNVGNDQRKYASFDATPKKNEQQSEKAVRTRGNKFIGGRSGRISGNLEENVSNQGDNQGTILPPPPPQGSGNQGAVVPDTAASDVEGDDTSLGPPAPPPEKSHGLEPPPVPPGFSYN